MIRMTPTMITKKELVNNPEKILNSSLNFRALKKLKICIKTNTFNI